jgi:hypothetical protein
VPFREIYKKYGKIREAEEIVDDGNVILFHIDAISCRIIKAKT